MEGRAHNLLTAQSSQLKAHSSLLPFQLLDLMQRLFAVEEADVLRLDRREAADGPAQVDEVRLDRVRHRVHADLLRHPVPLARIARRAGGDDVRPLVRAAAGERNEMVARERLARLQLGRGAPAVLTAVPITGEEEGVR